MSTGPVRAPRQAMLTGSARTPRQTPAKSVNWDDSDQNQFAQMAHIMSENSNNKMSMQAISSLTRTTEIQDTLLFMWQCSELNNGTSYAPCFNACQIRCKASEFKILAASMKGKGTLQNWTDFVAAAVKKFFDDDIMDRVGDAWKTMLMSPEETVSQYEARTTQYLHATLEVARYVDVSAKEVERTFMKHWVSGLPSAIRVNLATATTRSTPFAETLRLARKIQKASADTNGADNAGRMAQILQENKELKRKAAKSKNHSAGEDQTAVVAMMQTMRDQHQDLREVVVNLGQKRMPNIMGTKGLCFQFKKGICRRGSGCRWSHDPALLQAEQTQNPGRQQPTKGPFTVTDHKASTDAPGAPASYPSGYPPQPPASLLGPPPTLPPRQGRSGPSMSLEDRLAAVGIPSGCCIDFAKDRCTRGLTCKYTHHPK